MRARRAPAADINDERPQRRRALTTLRLALLLRAFPVFFHARPRRGMQLRGPPGRARTADARMLMRAACEQEDAAGSGEK